MNLKNELRACSRILGYFTPVHERGTKWDNIEEHIPTILRQAQLIGFINLAQAQGAQLRKSETEAKIGVRVLNRMTKLSRPNFQRTA
jgi:hypothetical protein|tara:strand:- start:1694 stop:1954 length:261 start_codon:yes stop_codon:yes gene_type:complete